MKRIIFVLIAISLFLVGCSKNESDSSVSENGGSTVTEASSEMSVPEISDKADESSNETSVNADKNESNGKEVNETAAVIKESEDKEGELPIIKEETPLESNKPEKNTAQEKNTEAATETTTQSPDTATEKTTGGVIELPVIPVK